MLPVEFKKRPYACRPVEFKGPRSLVKGGESSLNDGR